VTTSGSQSTTDTYVYRRDGTPLELIRTQSGATHTYWYEVDGRGNVIALTDSSGNTVDRYAYDLWGKPITVSESVPQRLRYTGSWYDVELGWYWLTTRAYDPGLGRFLQPDRSQQEGIFTYVYSGDDPVDYNDKSGMDPASDAVQSACADDPTSGACMAAIAAQRAAYWASTVFAAPVLTSGSLAGQVGSSASAIQTVSGGGAQPPTTSSAAVQVMESSPVMASTSLAATSAASFTVGAGAITTGGCDGDLDGLSGASIGNRPNCGEEDLGGGAGYGGGGDSGVGTEAPGGGDAGTGDDIEIYNPPFQPLSYEEATDPDAVTSYLYRVAAKYGINLRGSGQTVTIRYDPGMNPTVGAGATDPAEGGLVIQVGNQSLREGEGRVANTIAHELNHARDLLRNGQWTSTEEQAISAGENLELYILLQQD